MTRAYNTATTQQNSGGAVNPFVAGKNKIINGDFGVWQRGTSFSAQGYTADRFNIVTDSTITISRQTFTAGTAPVAGYEGTYFMRIARSSGGSQLVLEQRIEDVRTFAGQTVTVSFWAKADANTTSQSWWDQNFGSGGSAGVGTGLTPNWNITTSWQRFTYTFTVPSISGKTVGTSSFAAPQFLRFLDSTARTIDIWGIQLEAGSIATPFQTATGTIAGELAACQRYFTRLATDSGTFIGQGMARSGSVYGLFGSVPLPVAMRTAPSLAYSGIIMEPNAGGGNAITSLVSRTTLNNAGFFATQSGNFSANDGLLLRGSTSGNYIDASSEL